MLTWKIIEGTATGFAHVIGDPLGLAGLIVSIMVIALFAGAFSNYEQDKGDDDDERQ